MCYVHVRFTLGLNQIKYKYKVQKCIKVHGYKPIVRYFFKMRKTKNKLDQGEATTSNVSVVCICFTTSKLD